MTDWIYIFYFSILSAAIILVVMGLLLASLMPGLDRWSKRFFLRYFSILLASCIISTLDYLLSTSAVPRPAVFCILVTECLSLAIPLPMLTAYLLRCSGESIRRSRLHSAVLALWAVFAVVLFTASFTGVFSYSAQDNYYYRGPLYPLLLLPMIAILLLNLAGLLRRRKQLSRKVFLGFLVAVAPLLLTLIALIFFDVLLLFDISYVISALAMYCLILSDQIERDLRQQREIADQRTSILSLQMRPHFIHNTLMSIYYLCQQDIEKAQAVTLDFASYLGKSFNAVTKNELIPFTEEMEHTRAYLAVEKARFEGQLFVEFDTPHTFFKLPPLTLQPVVENAVKHGISPQLGPMQLSVRTRAAEDASVITVEDTGPGFSPADDNEPHVALANIRERLALMCDGTLEIAARETGGTRVTIRIPMKKAE